jgi:hypothetical protein
MAPDPPSTPPPAEREPRNRLAIVSVALGAAAALTGLCLNAFHADDGEDYISGGYPPALYVLLALVLPCGVAAVIAGVPAIRRAQAQGRSGMGLAGLGLGLLAIVLALTTSWSILIGAWGPG